MNITPRTCASCVYFDPANEDGDTCPNLVHFTIRTPGKPDVSHGATASDWCDDHQTAEEATTALHAEASPEFLEAMALCLMLQETLGQDHPEADKALAVAMSLAPQSLRDHMHQKARDMGLIPEPDGYTLDGQPAYSLETIAAKMGVSMEEAEGHMHDMLAMHDELGLPVVVLDPATIHLVQ